MKFCCCVLVFVLVVLVVVLGVCVEVLQLLLVLLFIVCVLSVVVVVGQVSVMSFGGELFSCCQCEQVLQKVQVQGKVEVIKCQFGVMVVFGVVGLYVGNDVQFLIDGLVMFKVMVVVICQVCCIVLLESYIIEDVEVLCQFVSLLVEKCV